VVELTPFISSPCPVPNYFDRGRYDGAESPDQMDADQRRRALFRNLGLEAPEFEGDGNAPAITAAIRRDLLALARGELKGDELREVLSLVVRFRSIAHLFAEISTANYRAGNN
jgi:hypothetical protein